MFFQRPHPITSRQQGTTLIVVLVLILLATVMALFAVKVNLSEQRASGNDVKTRLMRESAEGAMAQGMEYMQSLRTGKRDPFVTSVDWTRCTRGDTTFPCGAVPCDDQTPMNADHTCPTSPSGSHVRRANMYYYTGNTTVALGDIDGSGAVDVMERRMLPMKNRLTEFATSGNGFAVQYGVGAVLCALKTPASATQTAIDCATSAADESGTVAYTLLAVGSIPGEAAHTTLTQTVGAYNIINNAPGAPPIVASGSVDVVGNFQIVTNPNSGGPGVPISIWSRGAVDKHGTSNTCYYDEFIRNGGGTVSLEPTLSSSSTPPVTAADQILRCDTCGCTGADSLSFSSSGGSTQLGIDILQCSTGPTTPCNGTEGGTPVSGSVNFDIKPTEFPCDLFQYVFKTQGHKDTNADNFCEKQITIQVKAINGPNAGTYYTMGADEAFLYTNATRIKSSGNTSAGQPTTWFIKSKQLVGAFASGGCSSLGATDYGLYWDQSGSCVVSGTVGSVVYPLLLVADTSLWLKGTMFGFVFARSTGSADLSPTTGGNANYRMNAGAALYGAAVVQGTVNRVNGNAAIIYSDKVLKNLVNNSIPPAWGNVPGSWSDRISY